MLKYYSYYSVGGYKDFILGNSESNADATYYFPLLPVLEERAVNDIEVARQVTELKSLPSIKQLTTQETYGLPDSARVLFSHAGYKLIYKHLESDMYAIALRDISNKGKDEAGRSIPFLFMITGENSADRKSLDILCTYIASNLKEIESLLCKMLYMDSNKNGLCFRLSEFNAWVRRILSEHPSNLLCTINGDISIKASDKKVALMIKPEGISQAIAISEQQLQTYNILIMNDSEIISKTDPEKLLRQVKQLTQELNEERKKNASMKKGLIAAGAGGFIIGALLSSCCRN